MLRILASLLLTVSLFAGNPDPNNVIRKDANGVFQLHEFETFHALTWRAGHYVVEQAVLITKCKWKTPKGSSVYRVYYEVRDISNYPYVERGEFILKEIIQEN